MKQFDLLNSCEQQRCFNMPQESINEIQLAQAWLNGRGGWLMMGGRDYLLMKGFWESFSPYVLDNSSAVIWTHSPAHLFPWGAAEYLMSWKGIDTSFNEAENEA